MVGSGDARCGDQKLWDRARGGETPIRNYVAENECEATNGKFWKAEEWGGGECCWEGKAGNITGRIIRAEQR